MFSMAAIPLTRKHGPRCSTSFEARFARVLGLKSLTRTEIHAVIRAVPRTVIRAVIRAVLLTAIRFRFRGRGNRRATVE
ncbi:MAG: hypothetical protein RL591_554, partial [Planctomycetota bacterium]